MLPLLLNIAAVSKLLLCSTNPSWLQKCQFVAETGALNHILLLVYFDGVHFNAVRLCCVGQSSHLIGSVVPNCAILHNEEVITFFFVTATSYSTTTTWETVRGMGLGHVGLLVWILMLASMQTLFCHFCSAFCNVVFVEGAKGVPITPHSIFWTVLFV